MRARLGAAASDMFRSARIRNFRLFFTGQFVSQVGTWMRTIGLALLTYKLTGSAVAVGVVTACQYGPMLVLGPYTGLLADRLDKRRLLLAVQSSAMVPGLVLALLAFQDQPPMLPIYLAALASGVATAFDNPARRSFVVELVPEEDVPNAVSLNSAVMTSSRIFGPALAGAIIQGAGYGWVFLLDAVSYLAVIYGLWRIDPTQLRERPPAPTGPGQLRAGIRYVREVPSLWIALVVMAIIGTFTFNFNVTHPVFVKESLHADEAAFTLLFSVSAVGSLFGALTTARRRTVELRDSLVMAVAFGGASVLMAMAPTLGVAYALSFVVGFVSMVFFTRGTALVQLRADPVMRGRVMALQAMVFLGSTPIGGPIMGAIVDAYGPRVGIAVGGLAGVGAGLLGLHLLRRHGEDPVREGALRPVDPELNVAGAQ